MSEKESIHIIRALQDFRSARQKASLREIFARITGGSTELLSFDEVRKKLKAQVGSKKDLKDIPIKSIIGSVNRYQDFTRDFLPGRNIDEERWANVEAANQGQEGLPPIEAYQIDEVYFVSDGNHRVSVARQLGSTEIQAYVTEVHTRVPLTADIRPEDLIIMSEYAEFLEHTNLDKLRPEADLSVTEPGQYEIIEEHIAVHRYFMGINQQLEIPYSDSVVDWYDQVYLPVVSIIRDRGLLIDFPDRTEADLYLWIGDHRAALEENLQSQIPLNSVADDLADRFSQRMNRIITRISSKISRSILPGVLSQGPATGAWRQAIITTHREEHLFCEILVPINGHQDGWFALEQAIKVALREKANIHGLYVVADEEDKDSPLAIEIRNEFDRRCTSAGIRFDLQLATGDVTGNICERARWNDLVVINLTYPPDPTAIARLTSGIRNLIHRCPRPILFTPQVSRSLDHALLVYDGSPNAREALFLATYLTGQWNVPLHVVSIGDEINALSIQAEAQNYLENQDIQAEYITVDKNNSIDVILDYATKLNIDLLIVGGYSQTPLIEVVQGSDVDEILRQIRIPIIICR